MSKFCTNCGEQIEGNFCANCGTPVKRDDATDTVLRDGEELVNVSYKAPSERIPKIKVPTYPPVKKRKNGCLIYLAIGLIVAVLTSIYGIPTITPNEKSTEINKKIKASNFGKITGLGADQESVAMDILKSCGIPKITTIESDELLNDMNEDGEKGYRISSGEVSNIILYISQDGIVNLLRYADSSLYENGEIVATMDDYTFTFDEQSNLNISCTKAIKEILKSPSTAKFPNINKWGFWKKDGKIIVQSYVDSENSFGATLRSEFQFIIDKDSYTVESLIFDGEEMMN